MKALQNYEMLGAQKFVENVYYHELARSLVKFGYQIENKPRGDFEIKGVSPELVEKFSKRHDEIDQKSGNCWKANRKKQRAILRRFAKISRKRKGREKSGTSAWKSCMQSGTAR